MPEEMRTSDELRPREGAADDEDRRQQATRDHGTVRAPQKVDREEREPGNRMSRGKAVAGATVRDARHPVRYIGHVAAEGEEIPGATGQREALEQRDEYEVGQQDRQPVASLAPRRAFDQRPERIPGNNEQAGERQPAPGVMQDRAGEPLVAPREAAGVAISAEQREIPSGGLPDGDKEEGCERYPGIAGCDARRIAHDRAGTLRRHRLARSRDGS